jgi:cysteine sulfinate desulfinase/cysteine desulfurase-like protein
VCLLVDPRVLDAMLPHYTMMFGNPHSRTHHFGWETETAVEKAREVSSILSHSVLCSKPIDLMCIVNQIAYW